jgi:DNA-binding CsgD family transcriptional regulator
VDDTLIDRIYEAAVLPELWPAVLDDLSVVGKGAWAVLFSLTPDHWHWVATEEGTRVATLYIAEGWPQRCDRMDRLLSRRHAGFLGDLDVYTREEMDREPVFTEFHRPRGLGWGTATAIPVPTGEMLVFDIERRFETGPVELQTVARLDSLRPHLARAGLLSARLAFERAKAAAMALDLIGLPAAVIGRNARIVTANPRLEAMMPSVVIDRRERVALTDHHADMLLADALAKMRQPESGEDVRSFPIPPREERPPIVAHVVPVRRQARDVFAAASAILVLTPVVPAEVPTAEVIQGLFDLTPAEARVARGIAEQKTVVAIADALGVARETVRSQLKSVLAKTGTGRQAELAALLAGSRIGRDWGR